MVIPSDFVPSKPFERILTRFGFYIGVAHKDFLVNYLESYDNRPYMELDTPVDVVDDDDIPTNSAENTETILPHDILRKAAIFTTLSLCHTLPARVMNL